MDVGQIILYGVIAVTSILVIRIGLRFDINKWMEERRKIQKVKLKNICPHVNCYKHNDKWRLESLFISPSGTHNWICQQCGTVTYQNLGSDQLGYWANNIGELRKAEDAFRKQAKKMGLIP